MTLETLRISRWPHKSRRPARLILKVGLGMSFVLATLSSIRDAQYEKPHGSHTVDQRECHSEHRHEKILGPTSSVRQCKSCGECRDSSEFASKGRGRTGVLCKDCDNLRRRSSYAPTGRTRRWDCLTVSIESAGENCSAQLASLLLEVLESQRDVTARPTEQTVDSLLDRRNPISELVKEV